MDAGGGIVQHAAQGKCIAADPGAVRWPQVRDARGRVVLREVEDVFVGVGVGLAGGIYRGENKGVGAGGQAHVEQLKDVRRIAPPHGVVGGGEDKAVAAGDGDAVVKDVVSQPQQRFLGVADHLEQGLGDEAGRGAGEVNGGAAGFARPEEQVGAAKLRDGEGRVGVARRADETAFDGPGVGVKGAAGEDLVIRAGFGVVQDER